MTYMFGVSEYPSSLLRFYDCGIFISLFPADWNHNQGPAPGFEHSVEFCDCLSILGYMLKYMTAINNVKCPLRILNLRNIHLF